MPVIVITPPDDPVVSLEEAKAHLRVDHTDEDDYIESLVAAATGTIDGPNGWLGRALGEQTLEWRGDEFGCDDIRLPYPPLIEIVSVKYDDGDGVERTADTSLYRLVGQPGSPRLALAYNSSWPSTRWQSEAVRIQYKAGWPFVTEGTGDDATVTWMGPAPIKHAILLMVSELYENREAASDTPRTELPFAVQSLLSTYRILSF